jgi:hypothetical protein
MQKLKANFHRKKTIIFITLCVTIIICAFYSSYAQENGASIMFSDSFELGLESWDLVRYQFQSSGFEYVPPVFDTPTAAHGKMSLKIINQRQDLITLNSTFINLSPKELHTLSLYLKSDSPGIILNVALVKGGKRTIINKRIQLTNKWKRYVLNKVLPSSNNNLYRISLSFNNKGTLWIDGIQLQKGGLTAFSFTTPLQLAVNTEQKNNLYYYGEKTKATLSVFNHSPKEQKAIVTYSIKDFFKKEIARDQLTFHCKKEERAEKEIFLPSKSTGIFKVHFTLEDEEKKNKSQKELIYAIIPKRNYSESNQDSPFGIHLHCIAPQARKGENIKQDRVFASRCSLERYFLWAESIGAKWLRDDAFLSWTYLEPQKGELNWFDQYLELADKYHLNILGCLRINFKPFGTPQWARSDEFGQGYSKIAKEYPFPSLQAWEEYVQTVVSRYKDRVKYWEVWNEPNLPFSAEQYLNLLKVAYTAAKSIDPKCKIIAPASLFEQGFKRKFFKKVLELGAANYCDIFSIHFYLRPKNAPPEKTKPTLQRAVAIYKKMISDYAGSKELWDTESGYKTRTYYENIGNQREKGENQDTIRTLSAEEQANYLVRSYIIHIAEGAKWFYYNLGKRPIFASNMFGLIEYDTTPLPGMVAYAVLSSKLENTEFKAKIDLSEGNECYVFSKKDKRFEAGQQFILVAWNWQKINKPVQWNIEIPPSKLKIYNLMGDETTPMHYQKGFLINISGSPVYLISTGLRLEDLGKAFKIMQTN